MDKAEVVNAALAIPGWMNNTELEWLYETARTMNSIVEVGSWVGRSTYALASGCPGTVYAVDHFMGSSLNANDSTNALAKTFNVYQEFMKNCGHFKNLQVYRMDSIAAAEIFYDKSVDMVFIDADHVTECVLADIRAWLPKCKKLLCGHDYSHETVRKALLQSGINHNIAASTMWCHKIA